jgi:hypothetical protein
MCFKDVVVATLFSFFSFFSGAQIVVDDVGDGWKAKVDSALCMIEHAGPEYWDEVNTNCKKVTYWMGDFSTSVDSSVVISTHDMKLGSVYNIACAIIHESHHMEIKRLGIKMRECEEELECYVREGRFVDVVECREAWLVTFIYRSMMSYSEKCE